jgi:O-antigen ligase
MEILMNLIWFLTIATMLFGVFGEFGQFPFGSTSSISLLDIGSVVTIGFLVIWSIGISKKVVFPRVFYWLVGFGVCGVIGAIINNEWSGLVYLVRFIVYSLWCWVGYALVKSKVVTVNGWLWVLILSGILLFISGVIQLIWLPDLRVLESYGYDPHFNRMTGSLLDPNFFGGLMGVGLVVALNQFLEHKKKVGLIIAIIFGLGVVLSFSRSAYLMVGVMSMGLAFWRSKKLLIVLALIVGILFVTVPRFGDRVIGGFQADASAKERIESWQKGLTVWQSSPVFGVGFNNIRIVSEKEGLLKIFSSNGGNSGAGVDSSALFVMATTGVMGLICFGGFWGSVWRKVWENKSSNGVFLIVFCGLFIQSWFVNSLFLPIIMMWIYLWAGMVLAKE